MQATVAEVDKIMSQPVCTVEEAPRCCTSVAAMRTPQSRAAISARSVLAGVSLYLQPQSDSSW
jgi:hypothetical protein